VQHAKQLAIQINKSLNDLGVPINSRERALILSKMLDIPKQQAWGLLEGHSLPDDTLLKKIENELEISP
jgi:hypothetical protein